MFYNIVSFLSFVVFKIFFGLQVFGRENIPRKGAFILASNHASFLDPVVMGATSPRKLNFMAKYELFNNPWFGFIIKNLGAFPVKRNSGDLVAFRESIRRLRKGQSLLVFPEGTRQSGPGFGDAEAGIGFLAQKLDLPVVPAFIQGTDKAWPRGAKFVRRHKIRVYFGKKILIERRKPYQDSAQIVMDNIRLLACSVFH